MKIVKMQGGIGNQLFCLAFADTVARLSGGPVAIDVAAFDADRYGHAFALNDLAHGLGFSQARHPLMAARLTTALMRAAPLRGYVSEREPPCDQAALAALVASGRYFNGYWQHEAYIARPEAFVARVREAVFRRAGPVARQDVVIHYRTYKEEVRARSRRTPGAGYVRAALAQIEAASSRPVEVSLVSDDPDLALRILGDLGRQVTTRVGADPWEDLALLMEARALVLTNSSFSWWGGFCGEAELVVYPQANGFIHYPIPAERFACV